MPARLLLSALVLVAALASAQTSPPAPVYTSKDVTMPPERPAFDGVPSGNDPRVCLAFADAAQIIACAEKYRPRRSAAKA